MIIKCTRNVPFFLNRKRLMLKILTVVKCQIVYRCIFHSFPIRQRHLYLYREHECFTRIKQAYFLNFTCAITHRHTFSLKALCYTLYLFILINFVILNGNYYVIVLLGIHNKFARR